MRLLARLTAALLGVTSALTLGVTQAVADDATLVSRMPDPKIIEASGLAVSATIPDLGYTINDSNNTPTVYAIKISTGQTVGRTRLGKYDLKDTESLYVDPRGQMWLGDLGDNHHDRDDVSILVFPEPGPGPHDITAAQRIGVKYNDGHANVEAMLVNPTSGQVFLASKNKTGGPGTIYALSSLTPGVKNLATNLHVRTPTEVSDGTFSADGSLVLLRTYSSVWLVDPRTWTMLRQMPLPTPHKSESITLERGDQTFLVGGEGKDSAIIRDALPLDPVKQQPIAINDEGQASGNKGEPQTTSALPVGPSEGAIKADTFPVRAIAGLGIGIVAVLIVGAVLVRRR